MIKNLYFKNNFLILFTNKILINKKTNYFSSFDPYYILGVERNVDFNEIKKAFYKLANEFHPDKNKSPVNLYKNIFKLLIYQIFQLIINKFII